MVGPKRLAGEVNDIFMQLVERFEKQPYLGEQTIAEISDILGTWCDEVKPRQNLYSIGWTLSRKDAPILSLTINMQKEMDTEVKRFYLTLGMRQMTAPSVEIIDDGKTNPMLRIPFEEFHKFFRTVAKENGYDPNTTSLPCK